MKRILLLSLVLFLTKLAGFSQEISNVYFFTREDQLIGVNYSLAASQSIQYFNVSLWVSIDGGKSFTGPLMHVKGDVGEKIKQGEGKQILWDAKKEMLGFGGEIVFEVRADVIEKQADEIQQSYGIPAINSDTTEVSISNGEFFLRTGVSLISGVGGAEIIYKKFGLSMGIMPEGFFPLDIGFSVMGGLTKYFFGPKNFVYSSVGLMREIHWPECYYANIIIGYRNHSFKRIDFKIGYGFLYNFNGIDLWLRAFDVSIGFRLGKF